MHKYRSTNVFALLVITIIAVLATRYLISRINQFPDETPALLAPAPVHEDEQTDTSLAAFNTLIAQGWKPYRNDEMGIEFAYPEDGEIDEDRYNSYVAISFPKLLFHSEKNIPTTYGFLVEDFRGEALNEDSNTCWKNIGIDNTLQVPEKKTEIDGNFVPKFTYSNFQNSSYNSIVIYLCKNKDVYRIETDFLVSDATLPPQYLTAAQQYESDFNQILSGFHFLK
jgi:hypothetical protein